MQQSEFLNSWFRFLMSPTGYIFQTKRGKMTGTSIYKDQFLLEIICLPSKILTLFIMQECLFGNQLLSLSYSWQYVNLIRWPTFHHMRASWYSVPNCFLVPFIPDSIFACQLGPFFAEHPCINWLLLVLQNLRVLLTFRQFLFKRQSHLHVLWTYNE